MRQNVNLPLCASTAADYGGWEGLRRELQLLELDGVESIWSGGGHSDRFPQRSFDRLSPDLLPRLAGTSTGMTGPP